MPLGEGHSCETMVSLLGLWCLVIFKYVKLALKLFIQIYSSGYGNELIKIQHSQIKTKRNPNHCKVLLKITAITIVIAAIIPEPPLKVLRGSNS